MHRPTLTLIAVMLILPTLAVAPTAGQSVNDATDAVDAVTDDEEVTNETEQLLYQFEGGGALRSIDYQDGSTYVTLAATDGSQRFAVSEGDLGSTGSFEYMTVSVGTGETRTVELPVAKSAVVVTTTQDGFYYAGSSGPPVLTDRPTNELVQLGGISGIAGSVLALTLVVGRLRRKHENTYTELFSDEEKRIEQDAYEGWKDRAISWFENRYESKISTVAGVVLLGYLGGVVVGVVPAPGDLWLSLSDGERLIVAGTVAATIVAIAPMYYLADRLYQPEREYLLDLDSQDVYRADAGDKSGTVAAYSAPPERISEMDVDGGVTTIDTPGGRAHLVRGFDPETNEAAGNPPEVADDRAVSIHVQKIDHNRQILTDLATIGRDLIGAMSAFRVTADSAAMKDIDDGIRNTVSAGSDSMEDVLSEAVAGTRYEGTYQPDQQLIDDDPDPDDDSNDDEEVTNDSDIDPATNGADQ
jgi:hypothetical protein